MKIRTGFVSNSSSSSFIALIDKKELDNTYMVEDVYGHSAFGYYLEIEDYEFYFLSHKFNHRYEGSYSTTNFDKCQDLIKRDSNFQDDRDYLADVQRKIPSDKMLLRINIDVSDVDSFGVLREMLDAKEILLIYSSYDVFYEYVENFEKEYGLTF